MNRYKLFQAGVNVNEALERLGGDKELYDDLLVHFKGSPRYTNLAQALERATWTRPFSLPTRSRARQATWALRAFLKR